MDRSDRAWLATIAVLAFGLHTIAFVISASSDIFLHVIPWWDHIEARGIGSPVGNYAPPYLYLLAFMTPVRGVLADLTMIKLLAVAGACWMTFGASRILAALGKAQWPALYVFALPSVIANVSLLGQADTFWIAPCLLAVSASIRGRRWQVAAWAGMAFAFKQQAAWIGPFVVYFLYTARAKPIDWLAGPIVLSLAWAPAWIAGWPIRDLLTIYVGQARWSPAAGPYIENGASIWTLVAAISQQTNFAWRWLGLPFAAFGALFYITRMPRQPSAEQILIAATVSAALMPFLLPLMHERFFMLADVLAFICALAFPSRRNIVLALVVQVASAWPVFVWAFRLQPAHLIAPPLMAAALWCYWRKLRPETPPIARSLIGRAEADAR